MKVLGGQDDMCRSLKIMTVMILRLTALIAIRKKVTLTFPTMRAWVNHRL